jgi:hypothetical protein
MSMFPKLKTGAVLQYPASKELRFANHAMRFIDGSEQRYRTSAGALRKWVIRLDALDESEMAEFEHFFLRNQGSFGTFTFADPWEQKEYPNCSLEADELEIFALDELKGRTFLIIRENR